MTREPTLVGTVNRSEGNSNVYACEKHKKIPDGRKKLPTKSRSMSKGTNLSLVATFAPDAPEENEIVHVTLERTTIALSCDPSTRNSDNTTFRDKVCSTPTFASIMSEKSYENGTTYGRTNFDNSASRKDGKACSVGPRTSERNMVGSESEPNENEGHIVSE